MKFFFIFCIIIFSIKIDLLCDSTNTKCFTIDRSIPLWHTADSINTSVTDNNSNGKDLFKIMPNPVNERIEFVVLQEIKLNEIQITDLQGNNIYSFDKSEITDKIISWNLRDKIGKKVVSGVYFINFKIEERYITYKFIVQ